MVKSADPTGEPREAPPTTQPYQVQAGNPAVTPAEVPALCRRLPAAAGVGVGGGDGGAAPEGIAGQSITEASPGSGSKSRQCRGCGTCVPEAGKPRQRLDTGAELRHERGPPRTGQLTQ